MRYILIFFLMVSFVFAQVIAPIGMGEEKVEYAEPRQEGDFIIPFDDERFPQLQRTRCIKLQDLFDYVEECYNDSIKDYIHIQNTFPCYTFETYGVCVNGSHSDSTYYYRPTPTLEGFIEFLKKIEENK